MTRINKRTFFTNLYHFSIVESRKTICIEEIHVFWCITCSSLFEYYWIPFKRWKIQDKLKCEKSMKFKTWWIAGMLIYFSIPLVPRYNCRNIELSCLSTGTKGLIGVLYHLFFFCLVLLLLFFYSKMFIRKVSIKKVICYQWTCTVFTLFLWSLY